jgi:hypothetical protein
VLEVVQQRVRHDAHLDALHACDMTDRETNGEMKEVTPTGD